jgi:ADP-ribose pyrophosphatase YjhB (NUDIX family)
MRERLEKLLDGGELPWVSTFHAACVRILRREIGVLGFSGDFTIYDDQDQERLLKQVLAELGIDEKEMKPRAAAAAIDSAKNRGQFPEDLDRGDYQGRQIATVYARYQERLQKANALDFGDLLLQTVRLFETHSAVLEKNGRVLVMPAPPGSGKSTLCAALMLHGWRLLSDEMALLDPVSGNVVPAPRPVSLKNQSIDVVRHLAPDAVMGPVARDTLKGTVAHLRVSSDSLARAEVSAPPAWVVFPRFEPNVPLHVEPRPKARALVELASNSFNHHVHGRAGFEALAHLVDRSQCFDLRYGHLPEALAWFNALEARA